MSEPDVTLTDFALALECAVFFALILRAPTRDPVLRRWWGWFFASVGIAAFIGGIVHGFVADDASPVGRAFWLTTLLTLGVTSVAAWMIGSYMLPTGDWLRRVAIALLIVYAGVVLFLSRAFLVAIAMYLPATVFMLGVMIAVYRRSPRRALAIGIGGLALTFVAAAVQQLKVSVHPVYFNYNALYHVIQFVALWMIFVAAREQTVTEHAADISHSAY